MTDFLKNIAASEEWFSKREEILSVFTSEVYGKIPECEQFLFLEKKISDTEKQVMIAADDKLMTVKVYLPEKGVAPFAPFVYMRLQPAKPFSEEKLYSRFPYRLITSRGYAAIEFESRDLALDLRDSTERSVISKWAYGYIRVMDYIEASSVLDEKHICLVGHSRGGKTALWAGINDPRAFLTVSNDSGCAGAALYRGKTGERIADISERFPYWFVDGFGEKYSGKDDSLPFDQDMFLSLIAPRNLYVASSDADAWADPAKEKESLDSAKRIFSLCGGQTGYHIKNGEHSITPYDWEKFLDFADKII